MEKEEEDEKCEEREEKQSNFKSSNNAPNF